MLITIRTTSLKSCCHHVKLNENISVLTEAYSRYIEYCCPHSKFEVIFEHIQMFKNPDIVEHVSQNIIDCNR